MPLAHESHLLARAQRWLDVRNRSGQCLRTPEVIIMGVNNTCNLHCSMCDVGTGAKDTNFSRSLIGARPMNMPLDLLARIIRDAAAFSPLPEIGFAFTEPGIYPHIVEGIRLAARAHMRPSLTTNGWTLERLAPRLAGAGLRALYVSIDGTREVHDRVRGKAGSFDAAIAGIVALRRLRAIPTHLFCAITTENVGQLGAFAEAMRAVPIDSLTFMHTNFVTTEMAARHNGGPGARYPATTSSIAQFDPLLVDVEELSRELQGLREDRTFPFRLSLQPDLWSPEDLRVYYRDAGKPIGTRCVEPFKYLMVKSSGDVIAAHGRCYDVKVGNCYEAPLEEIWNSPTFRQFRQTLVESGGMMPACTRCCGSFGS
jgi:MoaA/NifB/PqqE/SkfB family radical SAM enzyme